jgi:hypothetical protein
MNNDIKKIYLGLPIHFKNIVFWVGRKFRKNILSHEPGGGDIIVEYHNGKILGYDWIKFPSHYVHSIFIKQFFNDNTTFEQYKEYQQVNIIKKEVSRLFARIYKDDEFDSIYFEEVWNSKEDNDLPWNKLKEFESKKEEIKNLKIIEQDKIQKIINIEIEKRITITQETVKININNEYVIEEDIFNIASETLQNSNLNELNEKIETYPIIIEKRETEYVKLSQPKFTGQIIDLSKFKKY